ncbi:MAG: MFS transporter [Solirubrobacterales bacterium]|nr:MFS transporter [Solirubrobacterales bacterium]
MSRRTARIALALAAGIALADASIVTLGLPSILLELGSSVEVVALVLIVYTGVLAVALPAAAWLAGRTGPARLGVWGIAVFAASSLACGLVSSIEPLLMLRAVQGVGGAAALVASFSLLDGGEPGPGRRLWVAAAVFGSAAGPALGGALTEAFDWRAIFLAQAPIALPAGFVCLAAARGERARPRPAAPREPAARWPASLIAALAMLSASLTAVVFLVVLLLVAGWSVDPLAAALAVTVLPVAAAFSSRVSGPASTRAVVGCLLVAGGVTSLAFLPTASPWWTVLPQLLAGAGVGLALPTLAGELLPERNARQAAGLLSVRHAGIALALVVLAPVVSSHLDSAIADAREQGTAVLLDARLPPDRKIDLAPQLFADVQTDDPRGELQRSLQEARADADPDDAAELGRISDRLDDVVVGGVQSAFRIAFIVTGSLALLAAILLVVAMPAVRLRGGTAIAGAAAAALALTFLYFAIDANGGTEEVPIADPCRQRGLPETGGIGGILQDVSLSSLDRAACEFGSSREELLLALFDDDLAKEYEQEHGHDPQSITDLGPALFGL